MNVNKIIVGNKCDCNNQRKVSFEEGEALAKLYNSRFYETSTTQDINVERAFLTVAQDIQARLLEAAGNTSWTMNSSETSTSNSKVSINGSRSELRIQGAQSWFNKNKINGRYIPHHSNFCEYFNVDSHLTKLVQEDGYWVIKKHDKVLARIKNKNSKPPVKDEFAGQTPEAEAQVWYENYGIFFTRCYPQPSLRCSKLDFATDQARESIVEHGTIVLEKFLECCKEPERLGLSVPLFVAYSRVKMAIVELDYADSKESYSLDKMQELQSQRQQVEEKCKSLLQSVGGPDKIDMEYQVDYSPSLENVLPGLRALIPQVSSYYDEMCDIRKGNLEVARKCRDTIMELKANLDRLENHKLKQDEGDAGAGTESGPTGLESSEKSGDNSQVDLSIAQLAERVVHSNRKDWTCRITQIGWVKVHESENLTAADIDFTCLITSGITESSSTQVSAALSAGMSHICASLGLDRSWSSSATSKTERKHSVKIPSRTKLIIEQEVVEGNISFAKTGFFGKEKKKGFRVAKDSLRIKTQHVA